MKKKGLATGDWQETLALDHAAHVPTHPHNEEPKALSDWRLVTSRF